MIFTVQDENGNTWNLYGTHNLNPAEFFKVAGGDITGRTRVKNKLFVSQLAGFQDAEPSILLAIGDNDTGFHSTGDGVTAYYSNGRHLFNMTSLWGSHNFDPNGKFNTTGGTINGSVTVTGYVHSNNDVTAFSDYRLKYDLVKQTSESKVNKDDDKTLLEKLSNVDVYKFKMFSEDADEEYGVIAQELKELFPHMVVQNEGESAEDEMNTLGFLPYRVRYSQFIPLLLMYTQSLEKRIKDLESMVKKEV